MSDNVQDTILYLFYCYWHCFAVAEAGDVADELARLVGDTYLDGGDLVVVAYLDSLSAQEVALLGARYEHDAVADAEGELAAVVHEGGNGQIGQGEQGATLTYITPVEVGVGDRHLGYGVVGIYFSYLATGIGCKAVGLVENVFDVHMGLIFVVGEW